MVKCHPQGDWSPCLPEDFLPQTFHTSKKKKKKFPKWENGLKLYILVSVGGGEKYEFIFAHRGSFCIYTRIDVCEWAIFELWVIPALHSLSNYSFASNLNTNNPSFVFFVKNINGPINQGVPLRFEPRHSGNRLLNVYFPLLVEQNFSQMPNVEFLRGKGNDRKSENRKKD